MQTLIQKELTQVSGGNITLTLSPDFDRSKLNGTPGKKPTAPIIIPKPPKPPMYEM